jgi:hypothetical protein
VCNTIVVMAEPDDLSHTAAVRSTIVVGRG